MKNWEKYQVIRAIKKNLTNEKKRDSYCKYYQKAYNFPKTI